MLGWSATKPKLFDLLNQWINLMQVLLRKISYSNWEDAALDECDNLPADVLGCLKTKGNTLSVWIADEQDPESLDDARFAIAASLGSPGHIELIRLDLQKLTAEGFDIVPSPESAFTSAEGLNEKHYDIINLNTEKIARLAKFIYSEIQAGKDGDVVEEYSQSELNGLLIRCLTAGKLKPERVATKFLAPLCKHLKLTLKKIEVCNPCGRKFEPLEEGERKSALIKYFAQLRAVG